MLRPSDRPLHGAYDLAVLDLDGVVYVGPDAVPGAAEALAHAREAGMRLAFVTNNASRPPAAVAAHLSDLGVQAAPQDVVTSAQAAARLLREQLDPGAKVFLVGGDGLEEALRERDLVPVTSRDVDPVAVVQGFGPAMPWSRVFDGAVLVRQGLPWVASNTDMTIPTLGGVGPGNGTVVRLVADFAEREPEVAGKPEPPLFRETLDRVGGERPLVVGDRLDTDIEGAVNVGWDSLLVLTGVSGLDELVGADQRVRPTYLARGLSTLAEPQPEITSDGDEVLVGGWRVRIPGDQGAGDGAAGRLEVSGDGTPDDWWRVVVSAAWRQLDEHGQPVTTDGLTPPE